MPKSSKTKTPSSRLGLPNESSNNRPFTPLRRFFFKLELLAPSPNVSSFLGKRQRERESEELEEREAGFEHLHAYDYGAVVEKVLDSRQEVSGEGTAASDAPPINVYSPDGARKWTKRPTGPRSQRQPSVNPSHSKRKSSSSSPTTRYSTPPRPSYRTRNTRVALQNIDISLDSDAVIITALDTIPFHRHEDLLSMSREEVINVARDLNAKLPQAIVIDTSDERPLAFIRNAIEVLVGIRPEVPPAPLRVGKMKVRENDYPPRFFEEFSFEELDIRSPLHTPLAVRAKSREWSTTCLHDVLRVPRQLDSLQEEAEEEQEGTYGRKRRRLSTGFEASLETDPDVAMYSASEASLGHSNENVNAGKTPTLAQGAIQYTPRVLRSHSRKLQGHQQNTSSAPVTLLVPKPKRTSKPKRKLRARTNPSHRSSSGSSANSENNQRNSIGFPTTESSSGSRTSNHHLSKTTRTSSKSSTEEDSLSLDTARSSQSGGFSNGETDSPFLSIRSVLSSVSGMSVCTRSTRSCARDGSLGMASREENGGLMDVSL